MATNQTPLWEEIWKRTPNSKHFHLADGSKQAVIFMGDVHYQDENGWYQNIDTALEDEADFDLWDFPVAREGKDIYLLARAKSKLDKKANKLNRENHDFQGLKVPHTCKLPRNWKKGYTVGKGVNRLTFKPLKASPSKGYIDEDNNALIVYQDAFNDVDVSLEIMANGIKETLILKTSKAPTTFSFEVIGDLADDLTAGELKLQPAWLKDADGTKRDVQQALRVEGDSKYLDLIADVAGLVYPIVIDPTVTIQPSTTGKDASVKQSYPTQNFNDLLQMGMGSSSSSASRCLMQFEISSIPAICGIISVKLVTSYIGYSVPGSNILEVHKVTSVWEEDTLTWSTQPSFDAIIYSAFAWGVGLSPWWDITSLVQEWRSGVANYGLIVKTSAEITANQGLFTVASSESTTAESRPYLIVIYNEVPTAPVVISPNGGETWNAEHTIVWAPSTDVLDTIYTDTGISGDYNTFDTIGASLKIAQTFRANGGALTKVRYRLYNAPEGGIYTMDIHATSDGVPSGSPLHTQTVTQSAAITNADTIVTTTLTSPLTLIEGTIYAIVFTYNGSSIAFVVVTGKNQYGDRYKYVSSWIADTNAYPVEFTTELSTTQANLQYQIQLSTDNGVNYSDIVALTTAGGTSYNFDFSAKPQSSTCLVRIRAYDGTGYGPWDYSDGVFTIQHNRAPSAPTLLSPSGGVAVDRTDVVRLAWQHNDPDADQQSKFDLLWSSNAGASWATVTQSTTNQYKDFSADMFPAGQIIWKIRTYDQQDLSGPYSTQATFTASIPSSAPTITAPTGTVAFARPVVEWSSVDQVDYQIQVLDSLSATVWDSGDIISTNKAVTIGFDLANGGVFTVRVRIKDSGGIWSDWAEVVINISYTPPQTPTLTVSAGIGYIDVVPTNPTPEGLQPVVNFNDIYRRDTTVWERIATNVPVTTTYSDYAVASGQIYEYKVIALGVNGTIAESTGSSLSITFKGVWLHDVADPSGTVHKFVWDGSGRSTGWEPEAVMMQYAGRKNASVEFGESEVESITAQLQMQSDGVDLAKLDSLIKSKSTLCFRDRRGRKMFGVVLALPLRDDPFGNSTTIRIDKTSYGEGV